MRQKQPKLKRNARKTDAASIRKRLIMLPLKSLLYAISYLMSDPCSEGVKKGTTAARRIATIRRHREILHSMLTNQQGPDGLKEVRSRIASAVNSYVGFFYSIDDPARIAFIERADRHKMSDRIPKAKNLIIIPAIMACAKEKRGKAMAHLSRWLYASPLAFLRKSSKAAMHIELLQQSIGLKDIGESSMKRLSLSMNQLDSAIERIMQGGFRIEEDSMLTELAVNEIVAISEAERLSIADFISEKLHDDELSGENAARMIRK